MSYRIGKVRLQNFGPFEDAEVDFGQPGLTGIEGVISWRPGANSNGAGKSKLLHGVLWVLFGECPDASADDVIRTKSKGGVAGVVEVLGADVRVERYRKHPTKKNVVYLFVGGKDVTRGTNDETQLEIDRLLGMNSKTFRMGGPAFGLTEEARSFFLANDTDRKAVLERILGLGLYAEAEKVAKQRATKIALSCAPLQQRLQSLAASIDASTRLLETIRATDDIDALQLAESVATLRVQRLRSALDAARDRASAARAECQAWVDRERQARRDVEVRRAEWQAQRDALRATGSSHDQAAAVAESAIRRVDSALSKIGSMEGAECPSCKRPVDAGTTRVMRADLETEREEHVSKYEASKRQAARVRAEVDALQAPEPYVEPPEHMTARDERDALVKRERELELDFQAATKDLAKAKDDLNRATTQATSLEERIEGFQAALKAAQDEYSAKAAQLALLEFWVESFGNRGLKSYLIESEIPKLTQLATGYAQRLCGPGAMVTLRATTALKSKDAVREKLSVEASIPGCCESYGAASKGQRRRLDLSLLFAFRALLSERVQSPFDQFFADELFDGLDDSGTESVIEFLREFSADCPVILVTHNPFMRKAMDRVITVRHIGEYHAVVDSPGAPPAAPAVKRKKKVIA